MVRPLATENDARRLVRAAQAGDRSAFAELYFRYEPMVRSIALSRLPREDAADLVQETFVRALHRLATLRNPDSFRPWIAVIARNAARDLERERATARCEEEPSRRGTQHDEMEARAALRAIRMLPKTYRTTVTMRLMQGMSGPEIADRTGLSPGSVRVNLHRGMKLLRTRLEAAIHKKAG